LDKALRNTQLSAAMSGGSDVDGVFAHEPGGYITIDNFNIVRADSSDIKRNLMGSLWTSVLSLHLT
jgi:hypothetical protein